MSLTNLELLQLRRRRYTNIRPCEMENRPFVMQRFYEMAAQAGIKNPELYAGDLGMPNASAISKNKIIISRTLLSMLDDREVITLLGHELAHSKQLDWHHQLTAAPWIGGIIGGLMGGLAAEAAMAARLQNPDARLAIEAASVAVGATIGNRLGLKGITLREDEADFEGYLLHKDKEAFASALQKLNKWAHCNGHNLNTGGYRHVSDRVARL
jgi:Zn-dependent protease with chaperone function